MSEITSETKVADVFETTACSRCGGSGQYSYCQAFGTRCFGCGGKGVKYTARGAEALRYFRALSECPASMLREGDRIFSDGWRRVLAIEQNSETRRAGRVVDDVARYDGINIVTQYLSLVAVDPESLVRVSDPATAVCRLKAAAEYQLALTKAGKPRRASRFAAAA